MAQPSVLATRSPSAASSGSNRRRCRSSLASRRLKARSAVPSSSSSSLARRRARGKRRRRPRGQDEHRAVRDVSRERGDDLGRVSGTEHVGVIQHGHERRGGRDRTRQPRGDRRPDGPAGLCKRVEHSRVQRADAVERGREVAQEDDRVVVPLVERHPGERAPVAQGPLGQQRRLAVAGCRHDGREADKTLRAQAVDEALARDAWSEDRDAQLRLEHVELGQRNRRDRGDRGAPAGAHGRERDACCARCRTRARRRRGFTSPGRLPLDSAPAAPRCHPRGRGPAQPGSAGAIACVHHTDTSADTPRVTLAGR